MIALPNEKQNMACSFEATDEVLEKMRRVDDLHALIPEETVEDLRYIEAPRGPYWYIKRAADILLSASALLVLILPMALLALIIYIDDPGKVFFSQYRVGLFGKRFKIYKFRTMKTETPKYVSTMELEHPERYITRVGTFLRKTSLDELPQLFNVLKGDMSIIGPRPLISDEYEIHQMRMRYGVYNVRPGITGLAQINGRDMVLPRDKVHWDVKYVEHYGFAEDLKIFFATIPQVFGKDGIALGDGAGTEKEAEALKE